MDPFNVVLVEPEIPPNTGSIARTCAATQSKLHLVGKLGFQIDEKAVRRAGLDYWHLVDVHTHPDFSAFATTQRGATHFFSARGTRSYLSAEFKPGDALVFGKESVGLPDTLVADAENVWAIPTFESPEREAFEKQGKVGAVRSLNLSNAVAVVLFEALRQSGVLDHSKSS